MNYLAAELTRYQIEVSFFYEAELPLDLQEYETLTFNDVNDDEKGGSGGS